MGDQKDGVGAVLPEPPEDFRPEGAEWEPAGGFLKKPPAPDAPDNAPTEGDKR